MKKKPKKYTWVFKPTLFNRFIAIFYRFLGRKVGFAKFEKSTSSYTKVEGKQSGLDITKDFKLEAWDRL